MKTNNWFRLVAVLLVVVVAMSMLATAWGAKKTYTDDPKKAYEVGWYIVGDPQPDADAVSAEASKYLAKKIPNTKVKFNMYDWGTWFGRIPTMIAASEPFDIFFVADWLKHWDFYNQGALLPLNDLIAKYAPKTKKELGASRLLGPQINGVNYALPVKKDLASVNGILFNKKYLDKYKFDLNTLKKPEDIEPWLKTIKENEPELVPFDPTHMGLVNGFTEYIRPAGDWAPGALTVKDETKGKFFNQLTHSKFKYYAELTYKWAQLGYIHEDAGSDGEKAITRRQNGLIFCRVDPLKPGKDAEESNEKVTYVQKAFGSTHIGNGQTGGSMYAISITSKNPVRCMKVLELANTDKDFCNLVTFGIEGKHYNKVGDNYVKRIPSSGWAPYVWITCNQYLQYLQEGESSDKWKNMEAFDKSAVNDPDLGFRYNKDVMSIELSAIEAVKTQFDTAVINGRIDPAESLPEWIQQTKDSGGDQILADVQKQFDAWKKATKKK